MDAIVRMYQAIQANEVSFIFFWVIVLFLAFSLISVNSTDNKKRALVELAPGVLTTLGILGTFTGVFIGLLDFDVRTINKSVPSLLEGLKVAFGTSIVGLAAAMVFRVTRPFLSRQIVDEEVGVEEVVSELRLVKKALSGDEDSSLLTQFQKLRDSVAELNTQTKQGFETQIDEFRAFSEKMSEAFSRALIDELKAAIRQFNEELAEQFGKNFQEFNAALGKVLEWQENYKAELTNLRETLDRSKELLESTTNALTDVAANTEQIPKHMQELNNLQTRLSSDLEQMSTAVSAFAELGDKASASFPTIEKNIENITENFKRASENQQTTIDTMGQALNQSLSDMQTANEQMLSGLQQALNQTISDANEKLTKGVDQLDQSISDELERVLTEMANNLTGITNQFVQDYEPLLQSSRNLIQLAEAAKNR